MADQSVTVTQDTKERVAFDLWNALRMGLKWPDDQVKRTQAELDFYVECRRAAFGNNAKIAQISDLPKN